MEQVIEQGGHFAVYSAVAATLVGTIMIGLGSLCDFSKTVIKEEKSEPIVLTSTKTDMPILMVRKVSENKSFKTNELFDAMGLDYERCDIPSDVSINILKIYADNGMDVSNSCIDKESGNISFNQPGVYRMKVSVETSDARAQTHWFYIPVVTAEEMTT